MYESTVLISLMNMKAFMVEILLWFENFQTRLIFSLSQIHYHSLSATKENKNQSALKMFNPKKNLNDKTGNNFKTLKGHVE